MACSTCKAKKAQKIAKAVAKQSAQSNPDAVKTSLIYRPTNTRPR